MLWSMQPIYLADYNLVVRQFVMPFGQKDRAMQLTAQNCSSDIITCSREQMWYRKFIQSHNTKHSLGFSSRTRLWQSAGSNTAFLLHVGCYGYLSLGYKKFCSAWNPFWDPQKFSTSPICGSCHSDVSWLHEIRISLCQHNTRQVSDLNTSSGVAYLTFCSAYSVLIIEPYDNVV
jgi:hypothetical protein